jgi:hypothetical protein
VSARDLRRGRLWKCASNAGGIKIIASAGKRQVPRLKPEQWQKARAYYEAGGSAKATGDKFGVSHTAVNSKVKSEGWTQDLELAIQRKLSEKLSGNVSGANIKETVAAVDAEAERRVVVNRKHITLAEEAISLQQQAIGKQVEGKFSPDFETQKSAKINSETVAILINLERKIHRLEEAGSNDSVPREIRFVRSS